MKKFTKLFLALTLMIVGWGTANAAEKQVNLTFKCEGYCAATWNAATKTFQWGKGGNNPAWTFMAAQDIKGDISSYKKLHLKMESFTNSSEELTVVFKESDGSNPPSGPTHEFVAKPNSDGIWELDLTDVDWQINITKLEDLTIYGGARTNSEEVGSVVVSEAYMIQEVADEQPGAETLIYSYDYTEKKAKVPGAWGQNPNGKDSIDAETGAYVIVNNTKTEANYNLQVFIANGFDTKEGYKYRIKITMMANGAGEANLATAPWSSTNMDKSFSFAATDDWTDYIVAYDNAEDKDESGAHVLWQSGFFVGEVKIKKVEVYEIAPDTPIVEPTWVPIYENDGSDVNTVMKKYFKNYLAAETKNGAIVVESLDPEVTYDQYYNEGNAAKVSEDHHVQFLISLPYQFKTGDKFKLSMKVKADKAADCGNIQAHKDFPVPGAVEDGVYTGSYLWYTIGQAISFTTEEVVYTKTITVPEQANGMSVICVNLQPEFSNEVRQQNTYYFDDIVVSVKEEDVENLTPAIQINPLSVTEAGYATFVPVKNVTIPEGVTVYTATLEEGKVALNEFDGTILPAGEPFVIEAAQGCVNFVVTAEEPVLEDVYNALKASDGTVVSKNASYYVLADGTHGVGFYLLQDDVTIPAGKAYLELAVVEGREFIGFADEATAIKTIENAKANGAIYNLAGQQVKKAQKGVYIIDGKKAIVK